MLERRLLASDERGLPDGVTDNKPTLSTFRLQLERLDVEVLLAVTLLCKSMGIVV